MKVVDLTNDAVELYCVCLEDWSDQMKEAGDTKRRWYDEAKNRGLRVKLALDDDGTTAGMIQYGPIEDSPAAGRNLYFIHCIWVHGYKEGRGSFQGRGMGKALLAAAEDDARALGAVGMSAWGLAIPVWMKAAWFKKQGYRKADRMGGMQVLLWKPFAEDAEKPRWIRPGKWPRRIPGQVTITALNNGWCPSQNLGMERARRAVESFDDPRVVFKRIDTSDRYQFLQWGHWDAIFLDGKEVRTGPPPTQEKIHALIGKRLKKL